MADTPIPDKAVTAGVEKLSDWLAAYDVGLDEAERLCGPADQVVRSVLEVARPHLLADRDTETAELRARLDAVRALHVHTGDENWYIGPKVLYRCSQCGVVDDRWCDTMIALGAATSLRGEQG